jgi:hypothetical protein
MTWYPTKDYIVPSKFQRYIFFQNVINERMISFTIFNCSKKRDRVGVNNGFVCFFVLFCFFFLSSECCIKSKANWKASWEEDFRIFSYINTHKTSPTFPNCGSTIPRDFDNLIWYYVRKFSCKFEGFFLARWYLNTKIWREVPKVNLHVIHDLNNGKILQQQLFY